MSFVRPQVLLPSSILLTASAGAAFAGWLGIFTWKQVLFVVLLVLLLVAVGVAAWIVSRRQAQRRNTAELESYGDRAAAQAPPEQRANASEFARRFRENVDVLRKLPKKQGQPPIYRLPFFLIVGYPGVGKSWLVRGSQFEFCVNDEDLKEGGTADVSWLFTRKGIFLDTAGRLTEQESGQADKRQWLHLLQLLRRFRRKRPIDGIIVAVAANELLQEQELKIRKQAAQIRKNIAQATAELRIRCPIFVTVTKTDLLEGFVDYFSALAGERRDQILGWTNPTLSRVEPERMADAFDEIATKVTDVRPALVERADNRKQRQRMFPFPEEFSALREPLLAFLQELFKQDEFSSAPRLAGFYFTSGGQEGTTISRYLKNVARQLGIDPEQLGTQFKLTREMQTPYFVRDLFWDVVAPSRGLVVPVDSERDVRKRKIVGIAAASAATVLLVLASVAYARSARLLARFPAEFGAGIAKIESTDLAFLPQNLAALGESAQKVNGLGRSVLSSLFLLNPRDELRREAGRRFAERFEAAFWGKVLDDVGSGRVYRSCDLGADILGAYLDLARTPPRSAPPSGPVRQMLARMPRLSPKSSDLDAAARAGVERAFKEAWQLYWGVTGTPSTPRRELDLEDQGRRLYAICSIDSDPSVALGTLSRECTAECFERLSELAEVEPTALAERRTRIKSIIEDLTAAGVEEGVLENLRKLLVVPGPTAQPTTGGVFEDPATGIASGCLDQYFKAVAPPLRGLVKAAREGKKKVSQAPRPMPPAVRANVNAALSEGHKLLEPAVHDLGAVCAGSERKIELESIDRIAHRYVWGGQGPFVPPSGGKRRRDREGPSRVAVATAFNGSICGGTFLPDGWAEMVGCLSQEQTASAGWSAEAMAQQNATLLEDARNYAAGFKAYWRSKLRGLSAGKGEGAAALRSSARSLPPALDEIRGQVAGLEPTPDFKSLTEAKSDVLRAVNEIDGILREYVALAIQAADTIEQNPGNGWQLLQSQAGPLKQLCKVVDSAGDFEEIFRAPVRRALALELEANVSGDQLQTQWQQQLRDVSALTQRYPFAPDAATQAPLDVVQTWLGKEGEAGRTASRLRRIRRQASLRHRFALGRRRQDDERLPGSRPGAVGPALPRGDPSGPEPDLQADPSQPPGAGQRQEDHALHRHRHALGARRSDSRLRNGPQRSEDAPGAAARRRGRDLLPHCHDPRGPTQGEVHRRRALAAGQRGVGRAPVARQGDLGTGREWRGPAGLVLSARSRAGAHRRLLGRRRPRARIARGQFLAGPSG